MTALLQLQDVSISYGNQSIPIVQHINLSVQQNECLVLLGHSGSGKSSLINTIAGYIPNYDGAIMVNGKLIESAHWSRGVVFQNASLYPWLTVKQNVAFGLKMRHFNKQKIANLVNQMLADVGLINQKNDKVFTLSGGMRQRVALARTLVNDPSIAMLDESFSALDIVTRKQMHQLILKLWSKRKNTFLFVTHDIDEALVLGQRIAILTNEHPGTIKFCFSNPFFGENATPLAAQREDFKNQLFQELQS